MKYFSYLCNPFRGEFYKTFEAHLGLEQGDK